MNTELAMAGIMENEKDAHIAQLEAQLEECEAAKGVHQADARLRRAEVKQKVYNRTGWLIILFLFLIAVFLMVTRDASAAKMTRERPPKPQIVQVDGVSVPVLVEQPMGETPQVELLDADGH